MGHELAKAMEAKAVGPPNAPARPAFDDGYDHVGLRDLFNVSATTNVAMNTVRTAQLQALVRLVPVTVAVNMINAALIVIAMVGAVPLWQLLGWFGLMLALCTVRSIRAHRLLHDAHYAAQRPTSTTSIATAITILALLWLVPPLWWFGAADANQRLFIALLVLGMMSGGSVTLASVPSVAVSYVAILTIGAVGAMIILKSPLMLVMALVYGAALSIGIVHNARQFVGHLRARIELEEQSSLIALLREFDSSGSDWLWELDGDLRLRYMSRDMAEAIGLPLRTLLGTKVFNLLDPTRRVAEVSTGMRTVFSCFRASEPFRDVAVPTMNGHRWWSLSAKPLLDGEGQCVGWRGVGSDITDVRISGSDAVRAARRDPLTGLANRLLVREQIEEALLRHGQGDEGCSLMLIDLDRFKQVNDSLGHAVGDQLLTEAAQRLEAMVGESGLVGRLGGDEFAVVWRGAQDRETLGRTATLLIERLSMPYAIGAASVSIGATIGMASAPDDGTDQDTLTRNADLALYRGKDSGRGGHEHYAPWMHDKLQASRLFESDVRTALGDDALSLAYQPIVDAVTGAVIGHEALLRWHHPTRGDISPEVFIPIIEEAGLISLIGDRVISDACREAACWPAPMRVAVNVSVAQFNGAALAQSVVAALADSGLEPERLELEVTESIFLGDDPATLASLARLRDLGVRLVLDDFGRGYSSFGYLGRADFAKIKIDQQFVRGAAAGKRDSLAIVRAILALADGLGIETTAEGIETASEAQAMRDLGCRQLQGFFFGRPVPAAALPGRDRRSVRRRA